MKACGIERSKLWASLRNLLLFCLFHGQWAMVCGLWSVASDAVAQKIVTQHIDSLVRRMDSTAKIAQISARTLYDTADNDSLGIRTHKAALRSPLASP